MRTALALTVSVAAVMALTACQVKKDDNNGTMSVTYNSDVAENAAADVGNTAQNIAGDIGNDVKTEGGKVQNRVGTNDTDSNSASNASDNKTK
jgi:hypothetical protein